MNIKARIAALERERGMGPRATKPPIEFFDRVVADTVTEQELKRWAPWLIENLGTLLDKQVERLATATGWSLLPDDKRL